jgi:signal transduction histidine kinase
MTTLLRHTLWPVGLTLIAVVVIIARDNPTTTYVGHDATLGALEASVAAALLLVGAIDTSTGRGIALSVLGLLWLVPELAGWLVGPQPIRTVADAAPALVITAAAIVVVTTLAPDRSRSAVVGVLVVGTSAALARLVLVDPSFDPRCSRTCGHNPLAINGAHEVGRWLLPAGLIAVGALVAAVAATRRWRRQRLVAATAACLTAALLVTALPIWMPPLSPQSAHGVPLFLLAQFLALTLALALCVERYRKWHLRVRLTALADDLLAARAHPTVARALGDALGDPQMRIDYWLPQRRQFVDENGQPVDQAVPSRLACTPIKRQGGPLGRFVHSPRLDGASVDMALGAALRLSLENERLHAATLAELHELHSSRLRIVEQETAERRRLERNLHDGAQQRIVTLSLLLRMIATRASGAREAKLADRACELSRTALAELRRVARGIYPAVLADSGLCGAVLDLAQSSSDVAVTIDQLPTGRFPGRIETTAYLVISSAISDARTRNAGLCNLSIQCGGGILAVHVRDDAPVPPQHDWRDIEDQVAAVAGRLFRESSTTGTSMMLELPCGS